MVYTNVLVLVIFNNENSTDPCPSCPIRRGKMDMGCHCCPVPRGKSDTLWQYQFQCLWPSLQVCFIC